ncbi:MAG: hypothetical protein K1060chlam1_00644 [Candidatus Anoxychlamydiales bacterium]|nr:hypothetical protein [Candidatus Anoxychlamydiales bacterium]
MTSKTLHFSNSSSTTKLESFSKKISSINVALNENVKKAKILAKLLFENIIFQASILSFFSFTFFASYLSFGSNLFLIAAFVSKVSLIILVKQRFSDFIYDLSTADSFIRFKLFEKRWPWFNQITKNIFLGAIPIKNLNHERLFKEKQITSILSIIEEKETTKKTIFTTPINLSYWKNNNFSHLHISIKDRYPISSNDLHKAADFINENVLKNKKIYVHCTAGRSRSAMAIIAYLIKYKKMDLNEAFEFVKLKRRVMLVNSSQRKALIVFYNFILNQSTQKN